MKVSTVLLIGSDPALIETTGRLVGGVDRLALATVGSLDESYSYRGWDDVALVLIHHDRRCTTNGVTRLLRMISAAKRLVATVVLADGLDEREASDLLRLGVADLLGRPFDLDRLGYLIDVLTLRSRSSGAAAAPTAGGRGGASWDDSDPMVVQARKVAAQSVPVAIDGEAGTGKSRLARIVHDLSPRHGGPFVTLRCATIAADVFEEELFDPPDGGRLSRADEGTLVLDDVDALSPLAQACLLHWIEGEPACTGQSRLARPRLIAISRTPLSEAVAEGRFRPDLFYRLNVIGLSLPPLRQRRLEIGSIASDLLAERNGDGVALSPEAVRALESYGWPGNIRELAEAIELALASARGPVLGAELFPEAIRIPTPRPRPAGVADGVAAMNGAAVTLAETKCEAEYARITEALDKHGHNRLRTAHELGISRMTLYKKLYKYGIIEQEGRDGWTPGRRPRNGSADRHRGARLG